MPRLAFLVVAALTVAACTKTDRLFCAMHPEDPTCTIDGGPDTACHVDQDCAATPASPVCELSGSGGTCVHCTPDDRALCTGTTPRCDAHACVACVNDGDCGADGDCLPTGACALADTILHVKSNGTSADCAPATPCSLTTALDMARAPRNVIRIEDAALVTGMGTAGLSIDHDVIIDARGAMISRSAGGAILAIGGGRTATLFGGTIQGGMGGGGHAIDCSGMATMTIDGTTLAGNGGFGIRSMDCKLTITGAYIHDNIGLGIEFKIGDFPTGGITLSRSRLIANKKEALNIDIDNGTFVIVGNAFLGNSVASNATSPVSILAAPDAGNRLEFNTIANNFGQDGVAGLNCTAGSTLIGSNNIIWNNGNNATLVSGTCTHAYSDIGPPGSIVPGTGNLNGDPKLTADGHLQTGSAALGAANPATVLTGLAARDIEGHVRTTPADLGAYQTPK